MSDLKKEAVSMHRAATGLRGVEHHTAQPLREFRAASHDLGALGALGSLTHAKSQVREGMDTLVKLTGQLGEEWAAQATFMGDVSAAFDLLDLLLAAARHEKG
ncbi:hypothetical protein ABZ858_32010 [Streptomyces sp. NPDC047017]|uniref:hypothetical protein n=1 Tax=Streptomyces sp. NPDC047017 TaxID=3155024 RepID=UPI0033E61ED3